MPRIRSIKPQLWEDELIGSLPTLARLTFIGLFSLADDEGRMRGSAAFVRAQLFAYDEETTTADVEAALQQLAGAGRIRLYGTDQRYLEVANFTKHQRIQRPTPSQLPAPGRHCPTLEVEPADTQGIPVHVTEGSRTDKDKGEEKEKEVSSSLRSDSSPVPAEQVRRVFEWWAELFGAHESVQLTKKRRQKIRRALKDRGPKQVADCLRGFASDPWRHEELRRYDIATLLRSDEQIDVGIDKWHGRQAAPSQTFGAAEAALARAGYGPSTTTQEATP